MVTEYIESEKLWRSEKLKINFASLGQTILAKLAECCAINPYRLLEVYHEIGIELNVKDVRCQTITVAQNLLKIGIKEGDTVILFSRSNPKITPITFACYTVGAAVNFFDVNLEADAINHAFEQINPTVIIFEEKFKSKVLTAIQCVHPSKLKFVLNLNSADVDKILFKNENDSEHFQPPEISDPFTLPAILAFTSGSTGMPKIAIHSHAMVLQGLFNGWWKLLPGCTISILCDLRWICQIEMMLQPVFFGVKRVLSLKQEIDITDEIQAEIIHTQGITHYSVTPMVHLQLLRYADESDNIFSLDSLKSVQLVGEVISGALVPYTNKIIPNCKVIKCYGMTELPGMVATNEFAANQSNSNGMALKDGFFVKIIGENGNSLGPNEKGRLLFKSEVPLLGYLGDEDANKLAFVDEEWFDTQDYAFMDDNKLLNIVTRTKFLLQSSAITVVPSEIENIVHSHESVLTCALIGHPNLAKVDDEIGTVFVVLKSKNTHSRVLTEIENELKKLLKTKLTKDQLQIVRYLKFIPEIPLTRCSKTDRKTLKEIAKEISSKYLIE